MNERVKEKCELLAENFLLINKEFKWDLEMMSIIAASIYTNAGLKADPAKMRECHGILKKKKGLFSDLRGPRNWRSFPRWPSAIRRRIIWMKSSASMTK